MIPRNAAHDAPIIVTLTLNEQSFEQLDAMRRAWFPQDRNFIAAHLTLFHALPAAQCERVCEDVRSAAAQITRFPLTFPGVRFLGYGVAAEVVSSELLAMRRRLATHWASLLSRQDQQTFHPHVTLQNKVAPAAARELFTRLTREWSPWQGEATGVQLHWYRGGPWELMETFSFAEQ